MTNMANAVWVYVEHKSGHPQESSIEVVCEGRRLADQMKAELTVLLFGRSVQDAAAFLGEYGADEVWRAESDDWTYDQPEAYAAVLSALVKEHDPAIFLFPATVSGEDLAFRVAARAKIGISSRCDKLQLGNDGVLLQNRLAYDNRVHLTESFAGGRTRMATVSPGAMKVKKLAQVAAPRVVSLEPVRYLRPEDQRVKVVGFIKADPATIDIRDAEIIVAGGKGVGGTEGFRAITDLAEAVGGAVAGSRMAVDVGAIGKDRQIGQSGKSVSPELLISCGISGANAHTIGMRDAKVVIAINKDKSAPLMKMADLGVVGDFHEIAPVLIERLKELVPQHVRVDEAAKETLL